LRQAYDYWQNQPDNYPRGDPGGHTPGGGGPGEAHAPRGGRRLARRSGRTKRPVGAAPPAHRGDADDHPITQTKSFGHRSARKASRAARVGGGWLRHTGLGWRGRTPRSRSQRPCRAQGGFLRESDVEGWPAANNPQTPAVPGGVSPPVLQPPRGVPSGADRG
jgi:hypothetical protein